ncbi:metal-dependent transcriptional regulator [Acetanaerobacterium elongatum]|uniref:Manganese transport regulator n=1 Tax=Acetanaerobacterium elongatum TaxID=258515 RepID=A0A1H0C174_9FIRM|nr:metal-dependent transcriptional regulator [Acetanaerobacterium elongatum]SDN51605.1 iron (metal) dependent repressor, DtxR family [Acetanaerobacterium elongatum]
MEESSNFHTVRGYQRMEKQQRQLTPAMEDYLEMIYRSSLDDGYIRINTLSEQLNVAAPSATSMVQNLSKLGLVHYKRYGIIFLTESGKKTGEYLLKRHMTIELLLKNLGVKADVLAATELIEHDISTATLQAINTFNAFLKQHPEVLQSYARFQEMNKDQ